MVDVSDPRVRERMEVAMAHGIRLTVADVRQIAAQVAEEDRDAVSG